MAPIYETPKIMLAEKPNPAAHRTYYFQEWCQMTGWHGVVDFYMAGHLFWKAVWLIVIIGGCFFAVNQSLAMILDFVSDDQWVTSVTYEKPKDGDLRLPNVTVCGLQLKALDDYLKARQNVTSDKLDKAVGKQIRNWLTGFGMLKNPNFLTLYKKYVESVSAFLGWT